jgi:hypothetical protein
MGQVPHRLLRPPSIYGHYAPQADGVPRPVTGEPLRLQVLPGVQQPHTVWGTPH